MMAAPPVDAGTAQETVNPEAVGCASMFDGVPGVVAGVATTALDSGPSPVAFVANTVTEYEEPFVSPLTVVEVVPLPTALVTLVPPLLATTVYADTSRSGLGAVQDTESDPSPEVTDEDNVGASGSGNAEYAPQAACHAEPATTASAPVNEEVTLV